MGRANPAAFNQSLLDAAMKKKKTSGTELMTLDRWEEKTYCMPLPHFCLQYLFSCTGIRFGGTYMIQGPPQSNKSPFLFWLLGYMSKAPEDGGYGGISWLSETENKLSPSLLRSFITEPYQTGESPTFLLAREYNLEDMFANFSERLDMYMDKYPEKNCPILQGIDSISGATTKENITALQEDGVRGRGYSDKPILLTSWFDGYSGLVRDIPIITFAVNHEKPTMPQPGAPPGMPARGHASGGEAQKFKASLNLKFSAQKFNNNLGNRVTIRTYKNSFGTERKMLVDFVWDKTDGDNEGQNHRWLWSKATVELLMAPPPFITNMTNLSQIIDVDATKDLNKVTSETLGVKNVSPEEFEMALMTNEEVYSKLCKVFQIQRLQTFDEYLDRLDSEAKASKGKKKSEKSIEDIPMPPIVGGAL